MMTFSQELADRVKAIALRQFNFTASAEDVLAEVFYLAVGQYPDTYIEELREDVRRADGANDESMPRRYRG